MLTSIRLLEADSVLALNNYGCHVSLLCLPISLESIALLLVYYIVLSSLWYVSNVPLDEPMVHADAEFMASVERHLEDMLSLGSMSAMRTENLLFLKIAKSVFNESKTAVRPFFKKVMPVPLSSSYSLPKLVPALHFPSLSICTHPSPSKTKQPKFNMCM